MSLSWTENLEGHTLVATSLNYQQIAPRVWKENAKKTICYFSNSISYIFYFSPLYQESF